MIRALILLALLTGAASAQESIPPRLTGKVPGGVTLIARPAALDCTMAIVTADKVHVDWGCVDAYATIFPDSQFDNEATIARLLKAVREGKAQ